MKYDFSGMATVNDLRCSDGRTIRHGAFADCDGKKVPLVWSHKRDTPEMTLGYAYLKNVSNGVRAYGTFNETEMGQIAKACVDHGDITSLSICATNVVQDKGDVIHGDIREVSLVHAGANPGARIDDIMCHSYLADDSTVITTGVEDIIIDDEIEHEDNTETTTGEETHDETVLEHTDTTSAKSIEEYLNSLTVEQKRALVETIDKVLSEEKEEPEEDDEDDENDENQEDDTMKHNVFEEGSKSTFEFTKEDFGTIIKDFKRIGSLKETVLEHSARDEEFGNWFEHDVERPLYRAETYSPNGNYGIGNYDYLFPDAKLTGTKEPELIGRDKTWVTAVLNGVHHVPFSRIKTQYADIDGEAARALGYITGHRKKAELFPVFKRTTEPTTIFKMQKMDRDDLLDITDFNVVAWIKREMRIMLNEEIARAILLGDGRTFGTDEYAIDPTKIRPIYTDDEVYTIRKVLPAAQTGDKPLPKRIVEAILRARKDYKGSGNCAFFTTEDVLNEFLLLEDGFGHPLYKTEAEVATALRASRIVTVPVMEGMKRVVATGDTAGTYDLLGIYVNLNDYFVGADKGGEISMFDDFDIDYNQEKYLMETRISGAIARPASAIVVEIKEAEEEEEP